MPTSPINCHVINNGIKLETFKKNDQLGKLINNVPQSDDLLPVTQAIKMARQYVVLDEGTANQKKKNKMHVDFFDEKDTVTPFVMSWKEGVTHHARAYLRVLQKELQ